MKMKELFSSKDKWTKGRNAETKNRRIVASPNSSKAYRFCIIGGIYRCYKDKEADEVYNKIQSYLAKKYNEPNIAKANDDLLQFEDVKEMCETLDI